MEPAAGTEKGASPSGAWNRGTVPEPSVLEVEHIESRR